MCGITTVHGPSGATKSARRLRRAVSPLGTARGSRAHFGGLAEMPRVTSARDQQSLKSATARPPLPAREPRALPERSNPPGFHQQFVNELHSLTFFSTGTEFCNRTLNSPCPI